MSEASTDTSLDKTDSSGSTPGKRRKARNRRGGGGGGANGTGIHHSLGSVNGADEYSSMSNEYETSKNRENIIFIYLDLHSQLSSNSITLLEGINNNVQTYANSTTCLDFLRTSNDRIFFITTSNDGELIDEVHDFNCVEVIFILNSQMQIDNRYTKLYGVYKHFEELLLGLKDTLQWFEETQMDLFTFEHDRIFLWAQLWREEYLKGQKSKVSIKKDKLLQLAEKYYQGNIKFQHLLDEFKQSYNPNNTFQWCFVSPFPSRFLRHSLRAPLPEHLRASRFLVSDISHLIEEKTDKKTSCELYKGVKMTNELLDKLETHFGELICSKGYLLCNQSRKTALEIASSPSHRPDLMPVLFKITYDRSVSLAELPSKGPVSWMVFDVYTVFRLKYVNRGQVTIVKIELADDDGRQLAREYRAKYGSESVQTLLDQLLFPPKPPPRLPPLERIPVPPCMIPDLSPHEVSICLNVEDGNDEEQIQELLKRGEIDQAIAVCQRLKPDARILSTIGALYAERKGDYDSSINYYKKALALQEKNGEDITSTLSALGFVHQNRHEYDLALSCHSRAFQKRKKMPYIDQTLIASNLIGMANVHWAQQNLSEALNYAQQALTINESLERGNELHIAANLAILANIHHHAGDTNQALEIASRALTLLDRYASPESLALATLINNIATMQVTQGLLSDARHSFNRALDICKKSLPEEHPKRLALEKNLQRVIEMEKNHKEVSDL